MLNRQVAPLYNPVEGFDLIRPQRHTFANGLDSFVFDAGTQELVRIEWIFDNVFTDADQALPAICTSGMLLEGTDSLTSEKIAEKIDFYGAFLVPEFNYDQTVLTLYALNKHLENLLPLVKDILTGAIFPEKELETYLRNNKQKLLVSLQKNSFVARRRFNHAVFGDNRYGRSPEAIDYEGITRDALVSCYHQQYTSSNCTLVISGRVTADVLHSIEALFGSQWGNQDVRPNQAAPFFAGPQGQLIVEERTDSLQSAIRLGYRSLQRSHPDFPGLQVTNTVLGGYFGSRLIANIREDKGYTYGIGSGLVSLKHSGFFTISSEVGADVTAAVLVEIEKEINLLKAEEMSAEELSLVKNYMMGSMLGSLENVFSHADKFKNAYFSGLDLDYYDYYISMLHQITPEDVLRLANQYLDYERMVKVVVGKLEVRS